MGGEGLKGRTILVIDDHPVAREVMADTFRLKGCRVITAADGAHGIARVAEVLPDAFVSDLHMPRGDAFDVLRHLRQRTGTMHVPVIVMTFEATPDLENQCLQMGATAFVNKNDPPSHLVGVVSSVLAETASEAAYAQDVPPVRHVLLSFRAGVAGGCLRHPPATGN